MFRLGYVALLLSVFSAECIDQHALRLKHQTQEAQAALRKRLLQLDPEQQQDLAVVVPYLKTGDKAAFKKGLGTMVQNGGNERIKRCLQGLSAIGFDALEIQNWMTHPDAPTPQSKMVPPAAPASQPSTTAAPPAQPSVTAALRAPPKAQAAPQAVATVGAMAGLAAEQQLQGGGGQQAQQQEVKKDQGDLKSAQEQGDLQKMSKGQAKAALRKELARRLAKGVQAFKRVESVEKSEASLQNEVAADAKRVERLEEALQKEEKKEAEVEKENLELKRQLTEEVAASKKTSARLDALEARGTGGASDSRVSALEEQNAKFRAALAGAARRLINLEADVTSQKQSALQLGGPKVVRHEKKPMPSP